ncbi:MAG: hypothetical protein ACSLE4_05265 [Methyloceanibacter sp.]|uniref:hypothetical protein n=1 Tax=Methyloceanibacter sp. TaxID=1965321 RepID=UPI003EDE91EF
MSRRARTHTSLLGLALVFLGVPLWWASRGIGGGDAEREHSGFVVPPNFQVKLLRAGLGAEALATAGISSGSVSGMLQAAADELNAHPNDLTAADSNLASARVESDRLRRRIQSGLASQEGIASYQTATSNLASAQTSRQSALDSVFAAATANVTAPQRAALTQIRANRAVDHSKDFPMEFLVVQRPETEWVALRDALANERQAVKYPDLLDQTAQSMLATWRADQGVSSARSSLDSNLTTVTTAWNTAAGEGQ